MRAKQLFFLSSLSAGVSVHLNHRLESVAVPLHLKQQPQIMLQFGLDFPTPIRNLVCDDEGISATLSFDQTPFHCVIPWESVYAMRCGEQVVAWPDNFPPELREATTATKRPQLRVIQGGKS